MSFNRASSSFFTIILFLFSCSQSHHQTSIELWGEAQGTTYHIKYNGIDAVDYQIEIDSILLDIDNSMSTYVSSSTISRVNSTDSIFEIDPYFAEVFSKAKGVHHSTNGAFDPTVMPLVNAWGFGHQEKKKIDNALIQSLLPLVNFDAVVIENKTEKLFKSNVHVQLDFNAIAQGYTVDVIGEYLEFKGIENYLVEVGGEVAAKGLSENDEIWRIGIDKPIDNANEREIQAIINLSNRALATSGNYRKYYIKEGTKYAHTINPKTGYPVRHSLLSVTVIANDCITADAYATAFMVMGLNDAKKFINNNIELGLDAYFIYSEKGEWASYITPELKDIIREEN